MGIEGAANVLFKVEKLTLEQVVNVGKLLVEKRGKEREVTAIIDASWYGIKASPRDPVDYTIDTLNAKLSTGLHCIVVFDPKNRHHTKVASIERAGK